MPYTQNHLYLTWLFGITGTDEVAQVGLRAVGATAPTTALALTEPELEDVAQAMITLMQEPAVNWCNYSKLVGVKVATIDTSGDYLGEPAVLDIAGGDQVAGTAAARPAQLSMVLSLRSGQTLGRGNYGRMYLPHCAANQGSSSPYVIDANALAVATAGAAFIQDVATALPDGAPGPWGPVIMSSLGAGVTKPITIVGCDNVVDTQRRRTHQLNHTYQFVAVP